MTRRRAAAAVLLLVLTAALYWLFRPPGEVAGPAGAAPPAPAAGGPAKSAAPAAAPAIADSPLAAALNAPGADIQADLRAVSDLLEAFRTNFPRDGNPVGDNAEITAALTGRNRLRLALIPPNHPALNSARELCDRWGTPFFFHAESATKMAIRSAGPDRKLWTADDALYSP